MITQVNDIGAAKGYCITKVINFHPFYTNLPSLPELDSDSDNRDFLPNLNDDESSLSD